MKKALLFMYVFFIFSSIFSINVDGFYKSIDLVNESMGKVFFNFTNNKNNNILVSFEDPIKSNNIQIEYIQEFYLSPHESREVEFNITNIDNIQGNDYIIIPVSVKEYFSEKIKVFQYTFPIVIKASFFERTNIVADLEIQFGEPFISGEYNSGVFFPIELVNKSIWEIELWGSIILYSLENNQLVFQKDFPKEQSITLFPNTKKGKDLFFEKYLEPGKYKIRIEIHYGYKDFFENIHIYEKEFNITSNLYSDRKELNLKTNVDYMYVNIPKTMSSREYITTPQESSFKIINNDILDMQLDILTEVSSSTFNPERMVDNEKFLIVPQKQFILESSKYKDIEVIADFRRANLIEMNGEYFTNILLFAHSKGEENLQKRIELPFIFDFGDNIYNIDSSTKIEDVNSLNAFYDEVDLSFEIQNKGNSSVYVSTTIKKWNSTTNRQVGKDITVGELNYLIPGDNIEFFTQLDVELGIDKIFVKFSYFKGSNPNELLDIQTHIIDLN
ncbi:hypothetical protein PW5551_00285 [Petrotoga sp. 9PW.55.5.1]|uniref:hypothetical protein n=1 Tax=Petrotoga sp. 9PW.55.5.1 TaxID=1308979 RepID=UPI000DC5CCCC|nr:hypothetical protein [Petrotoga sp. 9PW.55.5.1]RAP00019.1 hypothetical protein PW5551_00285 [Petrotoga sp. 9PW.55.5.1]